MGLERPAPDQKFAPEAVPLFGRSRRFFDALIDAAIVQDGSSHFLWVDGLEVNGYCQFCLQEDEREHRQALCCVEPVSDRAGVPSSTCNPVEGSHDEIKGIRIITVDRCSHCDDFYCSRCCRVWSKPVLPNGTARELTRPGTELDVNRCRCLQPDPPSGFVAAFRVRKRCEAEKILMEQKAAEMELERLFDNSERLARLHKGGCRLTDADIVGKCCHGGWGFAGHAVHCFVGHELASRPQY